jgi:hypothetical protein
MKNKLIMSALFACASLQLSAQSSPLYQNLSALPGGGNGSPIIISNNPESVNREGLLFGTKDMTPLDLNRIQRFLTTQNIEAGCPAGSLKEFSFYMHHFNQSLGDGGRFYLLLTPASAGTSVSFTSYGVAISEDDTGSLAIGRSPSYKVSESLALGQLAPNVATTQGSKFYNGTAQTIAADTTFALINMRASPNKSVDARVRVRASACLNVAVVATTAANGAVAKAAALAKTAYGYGNISTQGSTLGGEPCSNASRTGWGRPAGVYRYERWNGTVLAPINQTASTQGWKFLAAPTNKIDQNGRCVPNAGESQRSEAITHYFRNTDSLSKGNDSDRFSTSQYGVEYQMRFTATNNTGRCVVARLQLTAYPGQLQCSTVVATATSPSRNFDGAVRIVRDGGAATTKQITVKCPASTTIPSVADIATATLGAGSKVDWDLRAHIPGLISAPAGLLLKTEACQ